VGGDLWGEKPTKKVSNVKGGDQLLGGRWEEENASERLFAKPNASLPGLEGGSRELTKRSDAISLQKKRKKIINVRKET